MAGVALKLQGYSVTPCCQGRERVSEQREKRGREGERDRDLVRGRHAACRQTESQGVYDSRERNRGD
ncbi:hypothetical protein TB1_035327 [Malus domestica]